MVRRVWLAIAVVLIGPGVAPAGDLPRGRCADPLPQTDLSACDFTRARLAGRDLRGVRPAGAKLEIADLRRARLDGASLAGSNAKWANFTGATLRHAVFEDADMRDANPAHAGVWMAHAGVWNANFDKARNRPPSVQEALIEPFVVRDRRGGGPLRCRRPRLGGTAGRRAAGDAHRGGRTGVLASLPSMTECRPCG
jgi:hypothetical protein